MIDISVPLRPSMPVWPESPGIRLTQTMSLEAGDPFNVSKLSCDVHVGTHVDAPKHFLKEGATVEYLPLNVLIGPAYVAHFPEVDSLTADDLAEAIPRKGPKRLLLHTRNSNLWAKEATEFRKDYVALTADAAEWIAKKSIQLVGIDYLSVQRFDDSSLTHQILLKAGVVIIEGLNLSGVKSGIYELICLPLRLVGAEGAPARAVLRTLPSRLRWA